MDVKFVKEEKLNGTIYYTTADGRFVEGSLELNEVKARNHFDFIVRTNSLFPTKTVIAEAIIDYKD